MTFDLAAPSDWVCSVCLSACRQSAVAHPFACGHTFHEQCLHKWLTHKASCPLCRCSQMQVSPLSFGRERTMVPIIQPPMRFELDGPAWALSSSSFFLPSPAFLADDAAVRRIPNSPHKPRVRRRSANIWPQEGFFREILADSDMVGPMAMARKWQRWKEEAEAVRQGLEEKGATFVWWPKDGIWRPPCGSNICDTFETSKSGCHWRRRLLDVRMKKRDVCRARELVECAQRVPKRARRTAQRRQTTRWYSHCTGVWTILTREKQDGGDWQALFVDYVCTSCPNVSSRTEMA